MIEVSPELLAFLKEEEVRSRNDDLQERAETSLDSYNGEPYGDEEEGRSQIVTRDVAEVIDQMQISVLRTFVSGDRTVEFEPNDESQEQFADDATEAIQRQFSRKGYSLLHDWLKEGNLSTLGVVKSCAERKRKRVEKILPAMLMPEDAIEAEPVEGDDSGMDLMRVVVIEEQPAVFRDYLVPLEQFRLSPDHAEIDFDDAVYVAHATPKTLSDLVEMGFEVDDLDSIQGDHTLDMLSDARGSTNFFGTDRKGALRRVMLMEEYVRFDADGDGIAERLCVHRVGDTVLRIEPTDYQPFVGYCPFPMPGRAAGHALAEKANDIQRTTTVITRLFLDGQYINLAPGQYVPDSCVNANTYDDLLTVRPGRIIRFKGPVPPTPEAKNDVSGPALAALEHLAGMREQRTGITRLNQGLDADTLNKTATGASLISAQGQQMEEYIARNFAEALARLMRLKLKLMVRYGGIQKMRVDGEFREANPQEWSEDMDVVIRVGLGSGRKDQRLMNRMTLLQIQRECMMGGLDIVGPEQIYKSISGVVKDASLGSPSDFVIDPESLKVQNPETGEMEDPPKPPSPEEQKMQAEMQMQQAKMQGEQQLSAAKMQAEQQTQAAKLQAMREEAALKAQLARDVAEQDAQLATQKAMFEAQQATAKFEFEKELAVEKLAFEERRAQSDAARRDKETDAKVSSNRPGGKLDE